MKSRSILFALIVCTLVVPSLVCAQAPDLEKVLEEVEAKSSRVTTISCDFVQEKRLAMFENLIVSKGHFTFKAKDKLRWEYTSPFTEGFALDGDTGVRWSDAGADRNPFVLRDDPIMHGVATQLMAWASFDQEWLRDRFDIRLVAMQPLQLRLSPKNNTAKHFMDDIVIEFSETRDSVHRIELHEKGGDFTRITFVNTVLNQPISNAIFR
ncbi:LolA family protein [Desulfoplanes sp.]